MKLNFKNLLLTGAVGLTISAFVADETKFAPPSKFIDPANMDLSVKPGDNFFEYANGSWIKTHAIPAKQTRWGSFGILGQENTDRLSAILKDVSKTAGQPKGSLKQRVGDMYASGMDSLTIEKLSYNPIKPDLERISQINSLDGVINEMTYERSHAIADPLFGVGVRQDSKHPTRYIVGFNQGGTSLADRDYYLKNDTRSQKIQSAYKKYITTLFTLTGTSEEAAAKNAAIIFNIESALAKAQLSRTEMRDPNKTYNKFSVAGFDKITPHLNWAQILPKLKINSLDSVLVAQPDFFKSADALLASTSVEDWKTYLDWNILKGSASQLSSPFVKASFAFSSVVSGQKVQTPRNERMSAFIDRSMGELLGQLYVEKYFTPAAKTYMVNLVNNLKGVLGDRIKRLDWMSEETKTRALKKLAAFSVKIGYPDKWEEYKGLAINRDDYFGNVRRIDEWRYNFNINQLGKPVDKKRFNMTPPTVNANYSPTNNEITFPAGILQFPFFDFKADDAVNYGGIAAVIGHEMTHGFDDQGRQYDADGSLHDWWSKADADKFKVRADMVVDQYNGFTVLDTIHVNGRLTLGENLADLGGLNVAYEAFKKTKEGQSTTKIDGFTPDQRFFLSWAQVWRSSQRPESASSRILTDPHSPEQYRTNAPLTNIDAWYAAFNIQPGDKMYKKPENRIKIW
ncbi:MAG: family metallopeptidase [Mucilaginibacter sp.]|nr:family metallopeptidase [Mucilaginibacter sp.]